MILDHFYICVDDLDVAEQVLTDFGMQFTLHASHSGQGTRNACAFFENAYFELLACADEHELQSAAVRPLALWERIHWRRCGASPFGVALRGESAGVIDTWAYDAPFLPPGMHLPIVTPPDMPQQPMIFVFPSHWPTRPQSPTAHRGARRTVSALIIHGPQVATQLLPENDVLVLRRAAEHHLELQWDHGAAGHTTDFRPALPLTLHW
jgi:hypothetical protein